LRPFTLREEDASINVFNLDRKLFIPGAPVKNQCSRDYFYGRDDGLEKGIQLIESGYGSTLRKARINPRLIIDEDRSVFIRFWLFQHLRTEAAAKRAVEMSEATKLLAGVEDAEFSVSIKEAVQMAMRTFASSMHILDDLKCCLVKNKTKFPFITSDNPAVLTNRWHLENKRATGLSFGLTQAGALALLPLTPKLLFLAYDGDVYSVPNERGVIDLNSERDVRAFNQHQFLQCNANVYVHDETHALAIKEHFEIVEPKRPESRHVLHYAEFDKVVGEHRRYLVVPPEKRDLTKEAIMHSQMVHPHPTSWPSQIRIRTKGLVYTNGTGVGYVTRTHTYRTTGSDFWRERA
jgi:hypothetical protein